MPMTLFSSPTHPLPTTHSQGTTNCWLYHALLYILYNLMDPHTLTYWIFVQLLKALEANVFPFHFLCLSLHLTKVKHDIYILYDQVSLQDNIK